jgi:hypothetical protein
MQLDCFGVDNDIVIALIDIEYEDLAKGYDLDVSISPASSYELAQGRQVSTQNTKWETYMHPISKEWKAADQPQLPKETNQYVLQST